MGNMSKQKAKALYFKLGKEKYTVTLRRLIEVLERKAKWLEEEGAGDYTIRELNVEEITTDEGEEIQAFKLILKPITK